ncbi:hypothetical protein [Polymorphospora lycopeni]|uniref:Copper resistance protein D domain-containing protein n=1 Tax=Polymorphospora lycopeni TaxID=3140240 RepID=A0ABV5CWM8_9ACTN
MLTIMLLLVHAGVAALWLGAMSYSLFVLQPKIGRMFDGDPVRIEEAERVLAHGNRRPVLALITVLWLSGIALTGLAAADGISTAGWLLVAVKAVLLAGASGLFWWVSWRGWPRRVFALPAELPDLRRRFRRVALTMLVLVGTAAVLGFVGGHA